MRKHKSYEGKHLSNLELSYVETFCGSSVLHITAQKKCHLDTVQQESIECLFILLEHARMQD